MSDALRGGTTDAADRDGLDEGQTGTTADAGANAEQALAEAQAEIERLRGIQAQALAEKATQENLRREVEELRSRLSTPPNGGGAAVQDPRVGLPAIMQSRLRQHEAAFMADPANAQDSALIVGLARMLEQQVYETREMGSFMSIPAEEHEKVKALQREYAANGESISPKTARKLLGLDTPKAQAKPQTDADPPPRNVVATRTVGVSASELPQKTMTLGEFERRTANMTPAEVREFDASLARNGTQVLPE